MSRIGDVERTTKETKIKLTLNLDGEGKCDIATGIGFFDHMLGSFARHGFFDLKVQADGDLNVDTHHTVEDVGIVLGTALKEALGDKKSIRRFGSCILPMDDALVLCAVDLSGRPYFSCDTEFTVERVGELETETVREFFYALSYSAGMNLHLKKLSGDNNHHVIEGMFKALGRALADAVSEDPRVKGVLSTKGSL